LSTLNQALSREGFTIDPSDKKPKYYRDISHKYSKNKILLSLYVENPSFKIFIEEIQRRNIAIEREEEEN